MKFAPSWQGMTRYRTVLRGKRKKFYIYNTPQTTRARANYKSRFMLRKSGSASTENKVYNKFIHRGIYWSWNLEPTERGFGSIKAQKGGIRIRNTTRKKPSPGGGGGGETNNINQFLGTGCTLQKSRLHRTETVSRDFKLIVPYWQVCNTQHHETDKTGCILNKFSKRRLETGLLVPLRLHPTLHDGVHEQVSRL